VAEADADDIDLAVKAARKVFDSGPWRKTDARDRGILMNRLADLIEENADELAELETLDNGKPISERRNVDLLLVIDCFRYYAGWADKIHGQTVPIRGNHFCYTRREPVGVAGQIIPWNFPMMIAWKWGPALAVGCTIVLKPAVQTPLTALRLGELALEAGYPAGVITIVPGFGETAGAAMAAHPGVDKLAFTGATTTGQLIMRNAASTLERVTLELGGKSPSIVIADADADPDAAVEGAIAGMYLNQGQCCCAGARLFVQDKIHDAFVEKLAAKVKARKVGDPFDPSTEMGLQIDKAQFDKILSYIDQLAC
jgi:aldehyde dehydrogenase (NAD+)